MNFLEDKESSLMDEGGTGSRGLEDDRKVLGRGKERLRE